MLYMNMNNADLWCDIGKPKTAFNPIIHPLLFVTFTLKLNKCGMAFPGF